MRSRFSLLSLALLGAALGAPAHAITDGVGDWYSVSVAASHKAALDVVSADGVYNDGVGWQLNATMAGNVDPTSPGVYVWGFNRGKGTARFAHDPGVLFDSVLSFDPTADTASVRLLDSGISHPLDAGTFGFTGPSINAFIPAAFLPTIAGGFDDDEYTWNLWPRLPGGDETNVADFAPNNSMQPFTTVPEPSSLALLAAALPLVGLKRKNKRGSGSMG